MGFTSVREWDRRKLALDGLYFLGYTDGDKDSNKLTTGALMNWEFEESKWSWFAKGRYDYDQFNSWESRVTAHTGPGYLLYDEENFNLTLRAGLGAAKEFGSKRNEWLPEALFGAEGKWTLSERQSLVFANWVFPELDESEFRNVTTAAWSYSLDDDSNWAINVGLLNEYQSNVSDDNENNDLRLFGGLSFDF